MTTLDSTSPATGQRILVVDDEEMISDLLVTALGFVGFEVATADNGNDALRQVSEFGPDLVILDVMMPGPDGFEVCRRLRTDGDQTPIIFLTARDSAKDRVAGFATGADDYVPKPFGLEELIARVRAVLRRAGVGGDEPGRLMYADLVLDEDAHRVWRDDQRIELSPTEFRLLRYLMLNAQRVVSKTQILQHVWQYEFSENISVVETYISYLRAKIDAVEPKLIRTVRGVGYSLRTED